MPKGNNKRAAERRVRVKGEERRRKGHHAPKLDADDVSLACRFRRCVVGGSRARGGCACIRIVMERDNGNGGG